MSGSTTSETLMVTNTIFGLCAQETLGVRAADMIGMDLKRDNRIKTELHHGDARVNSYFLC